ncbi:ribonuclease R [Mycoplasma sp. 527]
MNNKFFKNVKKLDSVEILKFIQSHPQGLSFLEIVKKLNIHPSLNTDLSLILKKLEENEKIEYKRDGSYIPIFYLTMVEDIVAITNKRLGFIDFIDANDESKKKSAILFPFETRNLLDGDLIEAKIFYYYNDQNELLYKAKITKLLKHKKNILIGNFLRSHNGKIYFEASNDRDKGKFEIFNLMNIPKNINRDDVVEVFVLEPNEKNIAIKFNRIITNINSFEFPFAKILAENEVSQKFDDSVLLEASNMPTSVSDHEIKQRKDLRSLLTVTIDGLDTKDFDDAISCFVLPNGNTKLYIHIADVSYYVKEGSKIDSEALLRGTSIYLPGEVIPMLPYELSNGICSLNPNVDRCTITLELEIDKEGNNVKKDIYESVINSNYRLTYNEVNDYFNKKINVSLELKKLMDDSQRISKIIRQYKIKEGYVNFEIKEPKLIIENNKVVDIKIREDGESENMIEDFMVRANETIAEMMFENHIPSIYRVHDKPSDDKLFELQELIKFAHLNNILVPFDGNPLSFSKMVNKLKEKGLDDYIKNAFLRTMQKAVYSSKNIGHFGLASKYYSHFTSPIRRYPDLLLHRLIKKYLFARKKISDEQFSEESSKIEQIALMNSESERTAMTVERDIVDIRKAEYFESLINKTFVSTAVSIEKFGVFFNINEYQTSVLIRFEDLDDNVIKISNYEAKGDRLLFKVGHNYKIKIIGIEREKGNINASLC